MTQDRNDDRMTDDRLEALLDRLHVEKAPASLTRRLYRIPAEERRAQRGGSWLAWLRPAPRWVLAPALAAVPLLVVALLLMQAQQPSRAEVEQARHDVAVAFAYLDKVGLRTGREIQDVLGSELRHVVKEPLSEHMPFTESIRKEETS